jgi:hypothetical protein
MAKVKKVGYPAKLNKPLPLLPEAADPTGTTGPEIVERRKDEIAERLWLLLQHYGLDPGDPDHWYKLSCCLACDHVKGFQPETRGKEQGWSWRDERQLYDDVKRFVSPGGRSERSACHHLARRVPYCDIPAASPEARVATLLSRYNRHKSAFERRDRMREELLARGERPPPVLSVDRNAVYLPPSSAIADKLIRPHAEKAAKSDHKRAARRLTRRP